MQEKSRNITEGSIPKGILSLAVPSMLGLLFYNIFNLVDMYFVSRLGHGPLASVSISGLFIQLIYTFALGISMGTTAIVSRFEGAKKREEARGVGRQSLYLGFITFFLVAVGGNLIVTPVLKFLGAGPDIFSDASNYARIILSGSIVVFIPMSVNAYLRGSGDAVTPMKALAIGAVLNVLLDPIFIFGYFGFPAMGAEGSALATVIARGIGAAYLLYHLAYKAKQFYIPVLPVKPDFSIMNKILKIGIYGSLQNVTRNLAALAMMKFVAAFGAGTIAAFGVGMRMLMFIILPMLGLGGASATMVGQNLGAGQPKRAEKSVWIALGFGEIVMIAAGTAFFVYSSQIISLFNSKPQIIAVGSLILRYFSPMFLITAINVIFEKSISGAGDTFTPMLISSTTQLGIRIPIAWYLMQSYGVEGILMGVILSSLCQGLIYLIFFRTGRWKHVNITANPLPA